MSSSNGMMKFTTDWKNKTCSKHQPNHGLRIWDDPGTFGPDRSLFKDHRYKGGKVDEYIT